MAKPLPLPALAAGFVFSLAAGSQAMANSVADFYKGKTVSFVVGAGTGGGYDAYARLLVQHMASNLPGDPAVVVVNIPGASGTKAMNYVYNAAPKHGTYLVPREKRASL
jgi:tripartite-type tricarboxylate transporter receptor subunit TctC